MNISEHFTHFEMCCPTTDIVKLEPGFIGDLEELRIEYGFPMDATSCCRSKIHNSKLIHDGLPASVNSLHMIDNEKYGTDTCAIDIKKPDIYLQARLIKCALAKDWTVRVGKTFIHLDMRSKYTALKQHFDTY